MKKLVIRIFLFLIPFLLIATILDIVVSKRMSRIYFPSSENQVWNDIYAHKITDSCLIYGSSRAKTHINPMMIEDKIGITAYNFGMDGQAFDTQILRHKINVKENGYPKYIIHSLDLFTLDKTDKPHNKIQYLPYLLWNTDMIKVLINYKESFSLVDYFIPSIRFFGHYDSFKRTITEPFGPIYSEREKGFTYINFDWDVEKKSTPQKERMNINVKTYQLYENFIKECKDNNVSLTMIYSPEFINYQSLTVNRDSIINVYHELSEKYDIPFLDYTSDSICNDISLYADPIHFNKKGSIIFTEKIIKDLSRIGFFQ